MATDKKLKRKAEREKANRAEKIELMLWRVGIIAVAAAFFVGVGVTFVNMYKDYVASRPNYDSTDMVVSDLASVLQATEADIEVISEEDVKTDDEAASVEESESEAETSNEDETVSESEAAADDAEQAAEDTTEAVESTDAAADVVKAETVTAADAAAE